MKFLQKNKRCTWSQDTYMYVLMYKGYIPPQKKNKRPIDEIAKKKQNKKQPKYRAQPSKNRRPIDEIAKKKQSKKTT